MLEIVFGAFFGVSRVKPTPRNIQDHCRTHWVCWRNFFKTNLLTKTHPETRTNNWLTQLKFQKQSTYYLQPSWNIKREYHWFFGVKILGTTSFQGHRDTFFSTAWLKGWNFKSTPLQTQQLNLWGMNHMYFQHDVDGERWWAFSSDEMMQNDYNVNFLFLGWEVGVPYGLA